PLRVVSQLRLRGGGEGEEEEEEVPEHDSPAENETEEVPEEQLAEKPAEAETPTPKRQLQFGMARFFGSPEAKSEAKPVSETSLTPQARPTFRKRQLRDQLIIDQLAEEVAELKAKMPQANPLEVFRDKQKMVQTMRRNLPRRPRAPKKELTASKKLLIIKRLKEARSEYDPQTFWKVMKTETGLRKEQLSDLLKREEEIEKLSKLPVGPTKKGNKRRKRAPGAGRRPPYPEVRQRLQDWLELQRACGVTVTQEHLGTQSVVFLRESAEELLARAATDKSLSVLQVTKLKVQAENRKLRATNVTGNHEYMRTWTRRLLGWLGAKNLSTGNHEYMRTWTRRLLGWLGAKNLSTELVQPLTETEASVRCNLTWQEFDHKLWLSSCSSVSRLSDSALVADPKAFCDNRANLVIGFSDQVPLWAKDPGRRAVFSRSEIHSKEHKQDFSEVRQAIAEVTKTQQAADLLVGPIRKTGKQPEKGHANEERFRITYEARQLLRNVYGDPETPVLGVVGKGLLVVPGQWARLSNISADGKFIEAEHFKVGSKTILRGQGTSAGRILESYRKVRQSHPELVEHLEIMSQPAANVDSVILGWVLEAQAREHACSLWQRDCFSAVFSDSSVQKMALAQQIGCCVAAKCTSFLQITDSDFSKQFKAFVRKELKDLRTEFQKQTKGNSVFKVGALEIIKAVVAAQAQMSTKNENDQWVLRAAVRNGILAYRPNPQTGKLEQLLSQKWAKEMNLGMGTKRWLKQDGEPLEANWQLSDTASELKDLIRWDYYNQAEDGQNDLEDGPEIEDEFEDDLALEAANSLSLRVAPQLLEAHRRATAQDEQYRQRRKRQRIKSQKKAEEKDLKAALAKQYVQKMSEKLKDHSLEDLLKSVVPHVQKDKDKEAQPKKKPTLAGKLKKAAKATAKKKPEKPEEKPEEVPEADPETAVVEAEKTEKKKKKKNSKTKLSASAKPSKKKSEKPSKKKKEAIKSLAKAEAEKDAKKVLAEKAKKAEEAEKAEEAKKAEPLSAQPKKKAKTEKKPKADGGDLYLNKEVVVRHESAGATNFAKVGLVTKAYPEGRYQVIFDKGGQILPQEHFALASLRPDVCFVWPRQNTLNKSHLKEMLINISAYPQRTTHDEEEGHTLVSDSDSFSVVDPGIPYMLWKFPEDLAAIREEALREQARPFRTVLVPVFASGHWTILRAEKASPEQTKDLRWSVFDSLSERSEDQAKQQLRIGKILDENFKLPQSRSNFCTQAEGLNQCGFYCLSYIEQSLRLKRGEWLLQHPSELQQIWKDRLIYLTKRLAVEKNLLLQAIALEKAKADALKERTKAAAEKNKLFAQAHKHLENKNTKAAEEAYKKALKMFSWRDLSKKSYQFILSLRNSPCICSRCRWQTGCLSCDPNKALRYWVLREAW
ncbi:unnamed protein product, partial [Symbiodinium sp. CCMP2592]